MIVGLGETGMSCARFFKRRGIPFSVVDREGRPRHLDTLRALAPDATFSLMDTDVLMAAEELVVSPGVPLSTPEIQRAVQAGVPVTGDVAIFAGEVTEPIVAITGSNGKSTVTALVGKMANDQGISAGVGGNIGTPCLDLIGDGSDLYVLELSSYQLETASPLPCEIAVVLNLSPDHLDRYDSREDYYRTKASIYAAARKAVVNRNVAFDFDVSGAESILTFGVEAPVDSDSFGLIQRDNKCWLARGDELLLDVNRLGIRGKHNHVNALAALAIGTHLGLDTPKMLESVESYQGLEHRCELIGESGGVTYFNDSKSTNIASTEAAIEGLSAESRRNVILILGGMDKGADFTELLRTVASHVKLLLVYGQDAGNIASALEQNVATRRCGDLGEVVEHAVQEAEKGDVVLFSPACASFDMFENFEHRGRVFKSLIREKLS